MATLDVTDIQVVGFPVDTTVTVPGGDYVVLAGTWIGVPLGTTSMTVSPAGIALCMLARKSGSADTRRDIQCMVVDLVRTSA